MKRQKSQVEATDGYEIKYWYNPEGPLQFHRIDGPAIEYPDGSVEYWLYGKKTTEEAIELLQNVMKLKGI